MSGAPEHCDSIVLIGASRRQRLADSIKHSIEEWRQQWSANSHVAFEVDVAEVLCRRPAFSGGRAATFGADAADQLLALAVPTESQHELLGLAAPRITADSGETANAVLTEALRDLCLRLARSNSGEPVNVAALQGEKLSQVWARYGLSVTVRIGTDRVLMRARLFPSLLLAMLPSTGVKPGEPLVSRKSAIGTEAVPVHAWLGEADVALSDLAKLQIGDVILLEANVTDGGYLALPDGRQLAQIRLGSASGRRAVSVVGKTAGR
ncbi:FliM/FliN family flagellar motor switch protein [Steroidobacter flavus]|uniref:FliM/FliN family flagellar motor switch protein n=1 Tax=Steroidobacter flavus TaxID=1842136 RepID=A0ABV8SZZ7_9GAMM